MGYILIVGLDYKDCKAKEKSLKRKAKYTYATKVKHLLGVDFTKVIVTDKARNNPNYRQIMKSVKVGVAFDGITDTQKINKVDVNIPLSKPVPHDALGPVVVKETKEPIEEIDLVEPIDDSVAELTDEDFKRHMGELIEKEEESGEIMVLPDEEEDITPEDIDEIVKNEETKIEEEIVKDEVTELLEEIDILEETIEEESIPEEEIIPDDEESEIKPVNTPRGWHARNEFIDDAGNIFHKGTYVGKALGETDE